VGTEPEKTDDIDRVERAVSQLVIERARATGQGRRDVHLKHHGLVQGTFVVNDDIPAAFQHGVFQLDALGKGRQYKAWVRFSSSNKFRQSDAVGDGRGVAIKLLAVKSAGNRLSPPGANQTDTQDFLLLNGPAFFARNAADMANAAELQQKDQFPSSFFGSLDLLKGLAALVQMAQAQADSPLELTYFSQTPYELGAGSYGVKYRLRPVVGAAVPIANRADRIEDPKRSDDDYLYKALRARLSPENTSLGDVVFELAVQVGKPNGEFPLDDATVIWNEEASPFQPIGTLRIPKQIFGSGERMTLAENISFNSWNGFEAHRPLGSLNAARVYAYRASRDARHRLNSASDLQYTEAEWDDAQKFPGSRRYVPEPSEKLDQSAQLWSGLSMLLPRAGEVLSDFLSSRWGYAVAPAVLLGLGLLCWFEPALFDGPAVLAAGLLPSERMIPGAELSPPRRGTSFESDAAERARDPRWLFRYGAIGTEINGGIPYWIFRVLPSMFPERFGPSGDWSKFGLRDQDDTEYYSNYHDLPRGVVLTTPQVSLGGNQLSLALQLVAFNCATCHRGEYVDPHGNAHFVDGMPNTLIDAAGYKRAVVQSFRDDKFNAPAVIRAINALLAQEHAKRPVFGDSNAPTPSQLSAVECLAYAAIVAKAKQTAFDKPIGWLDQAGQDGPGRLDAFGALRYEFLGYSADPAHPKIATVDLPSIWDQSPRWRRWHHYDGNTADAHARNFGSIIGVGGSPLSLRKAEVYAITDWLDGELVSASNTTTELKRPRFPADLDALDEVVVEQGKQIYAGKCQQCHGTYTDSGLLEPRPECMNVPEEAAPDDEASETDPTWFGCGAPVSIGTDSCRARAVDPTFVAKLNSLGAAANVWPADAFKSRGGYLCPPLDGIWARAPYLHNGSVPTLDALLGPPADRPQRFRRGNPNYDVIRGGFSTDPSPGRETFMFDTTLPGNRAIGHDGPAQIVVNEEQRRKLIAYLLSL
jgi:hypothetical protein